LVSRSVPVVVVLEPHGACPSPASPTVWRVKEPGVTDATWSAQRGATATAFAWPPDVDVTSRQGGHPPARSQLVRRCAGAREPEQSRSPAPTHCRPAPPSPRPRRYLQRRRSAPARQAATTLARIPCTDAATPGAAAVRHGRQPVDESGRPHRAWRCTSNVTASLRCASNAMYLS